MLNKENIKVLELKLLKLLSNDTWIELQYYGLSIYTLVSACKMCVDFPPHLTMPMPLYLTD